MDTTAAIRNKPSGEAGFTLLELMFAAGILGMALAFLFGSLVTVSVASRATEDQGVAVTHLTSVLEELRARSFDDLLTYEPPTFGNLNDTEQITVRCFKSDGSALTLPSTLTLTEPLPNPLQVQVQVTWQASQGRVFSKAATQFLFR